MLTGNNSTNYVSIVRRKPGMVNPADPSTKPRTTKFKPRVHVPEWQPMPRGRMDGKDMGGRVGRSRGLGGNPTAWRSEGFQDYGVSEYALSFQQRQAQVCALPF